MGLRFDLYGICNSLANAHILFDRISTRNLFLWNGPYEVAISLFHQNQIYVLLPDNLPSHCSQACSALSAMEEGKKIHKDVLRTGLETDVFVGAALIDK